MGSLYLTWTHQDPSPLSLCFLFLGLRQFGPPRVSAFASPQVMVPSQHSLKPLELRAEINLLCVICLNSELAITSTTFFEYMAIVTRKIEQNKNKVFRPRTSGGPPLAVLCACQPAGQALWHNRLSRPVLRTHLFSVNDEPLLPTVFTILKSQL